MFRPKWILIICIIFAGIFSEQSASAEESEKTSVVHEIHIPKGSDKFDPAMVKIKVGETVTWINDDERGHPIASIPGKGTNDKELFSPPIPPGKSWSHAFTKAGEYPYFCYIHYVMMGAVIVDEQAQAK